MGDLVTKIMVKALNDFFTSVFNSKTGLQESKVLEKGLPKKCASPGRESPWEKDRGLFLFTSCICTAFC